MSLQSVKTQTDSFLWIPVPYHWVADVSICWVYDVANDTQRHQYQIPSTPDATLKIHEPSTVEEIQEVLR